MRIALDAMGGDHAPGPVVAGAVQAASADPELRVVLVGDRAQVEPCVTAAGGSPDRFEFFHCSQAVGMDESPVKAMRTKPDSSIARSWQLLAERKVDGIVSAGNTGAMVAGGLTFRRFLKNVDRPGIAAVLPTAKGGHCVLMDVGANPTAKTSHLFQYAVMGSIYARAILGVESPRFGLMNIGEEDGKGHEQAKSAGTMFRESPLRDQFHGNVEGRDVMRGTCDVVVTDGFVGNVVLKSCEGVFEFFMRTAAREVIGALDSEQQPKAKRAFHALQEKYDYSAQGGAPLLGIDGICIICHGSSGDVAIRNALGMAARYARARLNERIVAELEAHVAATPADPK